MHFFLYRYNSCFKQMMIARGATDIVYKRIYAELSNYMGKIFEEICKQYLWKQLVLGNTPIEFNSLGRWWGTNSIKKCQEKIDIMGEQDNESALFSKSGFTKGCIEKAKQMGNVTLVSYEDIVNTMK